MPTPLDNAAPALDIPSKTSSNILRGMGLMVLQTLMMAGISVLVKMAGARHDPIEITFWRSAVISGPFLFWLIWSGKSELLFKANLKAQLLRAALGTTTMGLIFTTYHFLPLAEAQSLFFATPLFVVALSWPVLKEKVGPYRTAATVIGFMGVLLMLQPGAISSGAGALFGVLSAVGMCGVGFCLRLLGKTEDPIITIFFFTLVGTVALLPALPFVWTTPTPATARMLIGIGVLALFNQFFLTTAHFMAPPSSLAPVGYLALFWALGLDFLLWDHTPATIVLCGAAIIIAANLFIVYRERLHARKCA